jgi:hypothetical protein
MGVKLVRSLELAGSDLEGLAYQIIHEVNRGAAI